MECPLSKKKKNYNENQENIVVPDIRISFSMVRWQKLLEMHNIQIQQIKEII